LYKKFKEYFIMQKKSKLFLALALALMLCFASFSTAFADLDTGDVKLAADEATLPLATITKILKMPIHTTTPAVTFNFTVTPKEVDLGHTGTSVPYNGTTPNMPSHAPMTISFTSADLGVTTGGIKTIVKQAGPTTLFQGVTFTAAGLYVYEITEQAGPAKLWDDFDYEDWMYYSKAKYTMEVWVLEKANGSGFYIYAIGTKLTATMDSWWANEICEKCSECTEAGVTDYCLKQDGSFDCPACELLAVGVKIDPTPDGKTDVEGDFSEVVFTNIYVKDNSGKAPDPTDPYDPRDPNPDPGDGIADKDTVFALKKIVADMPGANKGMYFPFSVRVEKPEIGVAGTPKYKAYVMEVVSGVDTVVTATANAVTTANIKTDSVGDYIEFTSGVAQTVNLKHGQWLAFVNVEVGSGIAVTELGQANYTPSYVLTLNNAVVSPTPGTEGANLGFPSSASPATGKEYIGEPLNFSTFTNTYKMITPMGISVNDLPFYGLIVLAIGGLAVFFVSKSRKAKKSFN